MDFILPPKESAKRVDWIDAAKGLGIFLIFYGHMLYQSTHPFINQLIYSFHVAFFFILSGYVFRRSDKQNFLGFLWSKTKRLMIPTTIFMTIGLLVAIFVEKNTDPVMLLKNYFYYEGLCRLDMPLWFFITLYFIYIISYFIMPRKRIWLKLLLALVFLTLGFLIFNQMPYFENNNPFFIFGFDKTVVMLGFFLLGSLFSDIERSIHFSKNHCFLAPLFVISFLLWLVFGLVINTKVSFYSRSFDYYWAFIGSSLFGSIVFIIISIYSTKIRIILDILKLWGKNSIFISGTHHIDSAAELLLVTIARKWGIVGSYKIDLFIPFYVIGCLFIYVLIGFVIDRYLPFVTGAKPYFYKDLIRRKKSK